MAYLDNLPCYIVHFLELVPDPVRDNLLLHYWVLGWYMYGIWYGFRYHKKRCKRPIVPIVCTLR